MPLEIHASDIKNLVFGEECYYCHGKGEEGTIRIEVCFGCGGTGYLVTNLGVELAKFLKYQYGISPPNQIKRLSDGQMIDNRLLREIE